MIYMTIYITDMPYIAGQYTFLVVEKFAGPTVQISKLNDLNLSTHVGLLTFSHNLWWADTRQQWPPDLCKGVAVIEGVSLYPNLSVKMIDLHWAAFRIFFFMYLSYVC